MRPVDLSGLAPVNGLGKMGDMKHIDSAGPTQLKSITCHSTHYYQQVLILFILYHCGIVRADERYLFNTTTLNLPILSGEWPIVEQQIVMEALHIISGKMHNS